MRPHPALPQIELPGIAAVTALAAPSSTRRHDHLAHPIDLVLGHRRQRQNRGLDRATFCRRQPDPTPPHPAWGRRPRGRPARHHPTRITVAVPVLLRGPVLRPDIAADARTTHGPTGSPASTPTAAHCGSFTPAIDVTWCVTSSRLRVRLAQQSPPCTRPRAPGRTPATDPREHRTSGR